MSAEHQPEAAFLATAEDSSEATVWEAILKGEGIPCWIRNSNFLVPLQEPLPFMNMSIDVFVPASSLEFARELLGIRENRRFSLRTPRPGTVAFSWIYLALLAGGLTFSIALILGLR